MSDENSPSTPPPPSGSSQGPGAPPPPPPVAPAGDNRGLMLVLSYLWILALIPYLTEQEDAEVKWHARHGLVLLVAEVVLGVGFLVLSFVPAIGCLISLLSILIWIPIVVIHIVCLVKALNGERFVIPYVSQYADQIP